MEEKKELSHPPSTSPHQSSLQESVETEVLPQPFSHTFVGYGTWVGHCQQYDSGAKTYTVEWTKKGEPTDIQVHDKEEIESWSGTDSTTGTDTTTGKKSTGPQPDQLGPQLAHLFWMDKDGNPEQTLPSYAAVGVLSASQHFDHVYVYTYATKFHNLPKKSNIEVRDANRFLSRDEYDYLKNKKNIPIPLLSDLVRFRAAAEFGGWVVDMDTIWIRKPGIHTCVATLWAKGGNSNMAPTLPHAREWAKDGWDGRGYVGTPFNINKAETPGFGVAIEQMCATNYNIMMNGEAFRKPTPTKTQSFLFMRGIRTAMEQNHLQSTIVSPLYYAAVPFWYPQCRYLVLDGWFERPDDQRVVYGVQLPSLNEILTHAFCVPTSFTLGPNNNVANRLELAGMDVMASAKTHPSSLLASLVQIVIENESENAGGGKSSSKRKRRH